MTPQRRWSLTWFATTLAVLVPIAVAIGVFLAPNAVAVVLLHNDRPGDGAFVDAGVAPVNIEGTTPVSSGGEVDPTEENVFGDAGFADLCQIDEQRRQLGQDQETAAAFADALGIDPDQIGDVLTSYRQVVLLVDVRVTSHQLADGEAQRVQAVVQAGSPVLIDADGTLRMRCLGANPLDEPEQAEDEDFDGDAWPGFQAQQVVIVDVQVGEPPIVEPISTTPQTPTPTSTVQPTPTVRPSLAEIPVEGAIERPGDEDSFTFDVAGGFAQSGRLIWCRLGVVRRGSG